jgi:Protein kinase domain
VRRCWRRTLISRAAEASTLTVASRVIGTPAFMSPEQAGGSRDIGPASDVFSLGSVLTFVATGKGPFTAGNGLPVALALQIISAAPDIGGVPSELRSLIGRCLAKDPTQRPTTAQIIAELGPARLGQGWLPTPIARTLHEYDRPAAGSTGRPGWTPTARAGQSSPAAGAGGPHGGFPDLATVSGPVAPPASPPRESMPATRTSARAPQTRRSAASAGPIGQVRFSTRKPRRLFKGVVGVAVLPAVIAWVWELVTLISKQVAAGGAHSAAPYGLLALILGIFGLLILAGLVGIMTDRS